MDHRLTVYTAVFGFTDPLHEPAVIGKGTRSVCFTDQPLQSKTWEIVRTPPQTAPTRAARRLKALSHLVFPDVEWTLWADASFVIVIDADTPKRFGEFVTFRHPDRNRIKDEGAEIIKSGKAKADAIEHQLEYYRSEGFDTDASPMRELSCTGAILRKHTPKVIQTNHLWAQQLEHFTLRDQMSLDYWRMLAQNG